MLLNYGRGLWVTTPSADGFADSPWQLWEHPLACGSIPGKRGAALEVIHPEVVRLAGADLSIGRKYF